jgi:hypothetical protein
MQVQHVTEFSLAPGFSPVSVADDAASRFNGFSSRPVKPLKRLGPWGTNDTGLKPGANERIDSERHGPRVNAPFCFLPCH